MGGVQETPGFLWGVLKGQGWGLEVPDPSQPSTPMGVLADAQPPTAYVTCW